jgi:chromosome partitioning protein
MAREMKLSEALTDGVKEYGLVLVDCPPSLGLLTVNALAAADDLLVPVQCEYYALEGLGQLLRSAERARRVLNPDLRVGGFLLTMFDARTKLSSEVAEEVRGHFEELVYETVVPRSVRLSEAPSFGEPVVTLDPSSRGSIAFRLLAAEVEQRYELMRPQDHPKELVVSAARAPGGSGVRGYGTVAPEPRGLNQAWPRRSPWEVDS